MTFSIMPADHTKEVTVEQVREALGDGLSSAANISSYYGGVWVIANQEVSDAAVGLSGSHGWTVQAQSEPQ